MRKSPDPEGLPFLTFPAASARPPTLPVEVELAPFFRLFSVFFACKKTLKKRMVKKSTFFANFGDFGASDVDFQQFLVSKQVPGGNFFGVF